MLKAELNQAELKGGQRIPLNILEKTLKAIDGVLKIKDCATVSIAFISSSKIKKLNKSYRGKNEVTDVLSFGLDGDESVLGEVLICYQQAKRQAKQMKHSVRDEVIFLVTHGVLHLLGFDHDRTSDAKKMFVIQKKILDKLGVDSRL